MTRNKQERKPECDSDELIDAAKKAAGNWRKFESFGWGRVGELDEPENWTIVYTHHRDSGLLDQSNAAVIEKALSAFLEGDDPDIIEEHHGHWACGWIDGFAIRVFRDGEVARRFGRTWRLLTAWTTTRSWMKRTTAAGNTKPPWQTSTVQYRASGTTTSFPKAGGGKYSAGSGRMTSEPSKTGTIPAGIRMKSSWNLLSPPLVIQRTEE